MNPKQTFKPDYKVAPKETLIELMQDKNISVLQLSKQAGIELDALNAIIDENAEINSEIAAGLEKVFGTPISFWLNLEANYRN